MKCSNPFVQDGKAFGCGQCLPCRINRRRIWAHRIVLEAGLYEDNCFLGLTLNDDHLVNAQGEADLMSASLVPRDTQLWLKRLRKKLAPVKFRYFLVGEYGDVKKRPHYHVALFGVATCARGRTKRRPGKTRPVWEECCDQCRLFGQSWGKGDIDAGTVEPHSAQYIAGYTTKKLTSKDDPRLEGRHPEFARQSNRPGIGHDAMYEVASTLMLHGLENTLSDVPTTLRHGAKQLPLGTYLTRKLRKMVGKDEKAPQATLDKMAAEMQPLRDLAYNTSQSFAKTIVKHSKGTKRLTRGKTKNT